MILRTARFFPERDDTQRALSGPNLKANEFLHRRLTVEDAAEAHLAALQRAPSIGFGTFVVSAPVPFVRSDAEALKRDAAGVVAREQLAWQAWMGKHFPAPSEAGQGG